MKRNIVVALSIFVLSCDQFYAAEPKLINSESVPQRLQKVREELTQLRKIVETNEKMTHTQNYQQRIDQLEKIVLAVETLYAQWEKDNA